MFRRRLGLAITCALLVTVPAAAHDVPQRHVMNAFVKVDGHQAHLVVRVPLDILPTVQFPVKGREIDFAAAGPAAKRALEGIAHDVALWEGGVQLAPASAMGRLSLPSDRSFEQYESAVAHVNEPVDTGIAVYYDQGFFDAQFTYPVRSSDSGFAVRTMVNAELRDYTKLAVRYLAADGSSAAFLISPASGRVALNPAWYQAAGEFVLLGIEHILTGADHLLFLLCLVIPVLALRQVVPIVTAFTVAHSFTLLGSAYGVGPSGPWFPPFVETAIAASIVYMALENILGADLRRRWLITGIFGLVHGFGFSYGLKENLQFAGRHLVVSLLTFNVGIEIGQLAVLAVLLPVLAVLRRHALAGRAGVIVLSALVADVGWHWLRERAAVLRTVRWPRMDLLALASLARWVAGLLLAAILFRWIAHRGTAIWSRRSARNPAPYV
jgi:hypothetical protein